MEPPYDPDAEYDDEFLEYARRALEMAGIQTDGALKQEKPIRHSLLHAISEQPFLYKVAQEALPQGTAHWEQAKFVGAALRPAIWDLQWGAIKSYDQFAYLYWRILGERSREFLPQLFVAAALSPSIVEEFRLQLIGTLTHFHLKD